MTTKTHYSTSLLRRVAGGCIALLLTTGLALAAAEGGGADAGGLELIKIRPAAHKPAQGVALNVQLKPEFNSYKVGQAIRFKVSGSKRFFLYLFNIDPATGKGITILPNRLQGKTKNMYKPGKWYTVPNANLEFYADRAGVERVVMVASERYLDVDKLLGAGRSKAAGNFYEMESVTDGLDAVLTALQAKDGGHEQIKVRDAASAPLPRGVVVQEIKLTIY